jgi:chromosome segregation ATPase
MSSKTFVIVALAIGLGLAAAYFYMPSSESTDEADNASILVMDDQLTPSSLSEAPPALPEETTEAPRPEAETSSLLELEAELVSTVLKREEIEEALRVVELKIGALEAQLDDIELRGDNPADVQDETLGSFQAIFAEYQDAINALEEIEDEEIWLEEKISELKE